MMRIILLLQRRLIMSLSYGSVIHEKPAPGSAFVIAGMLMAGILLVALSAALGVDSSSAAAMLGP
jgi:hypothetical protein